MKTKAYTEKKQRNLLGVEEEENVDTATLTERVSESEEIHYDQSVSKEDVTGTHVSMEEWNIANALNLSNAEMEIAKGDEEKIFLAHLDESVLLDSHLSDEEDILQGHVQMSSNV